MRNEPAALLAALLLSPVRVSAASAEPELVEFERAPKPKAPRRAALPAASPDPALDPLRRRPEPSARPDTARQIKLDRDEARDRIRLGKKRRPWIVFRERAWYARAESRTRTATLVPAGTFFPPTGDVYEGETQETDVTSWLLIHGAEFAPLRWLSFELEYGETRSGGGRFTSREWVHAPAAANLMHAGNGSTWNTPDHEDDETLEAPAALRRDWLAFSVHGRVHEGRITTGDEFELSHALDLTVGGHRWRQDGRMKDLRRTLSTAKFHAGGPLGPVAGFDSTYSSEWHGTHFGFREEMYAPYGFSFEGVLLWSPFMEYRGDGHDNITAGLRGETPNFTDRSHGSALHFRVGAAWTWTYARLEAGFSRLRFYSRNGTRRTYLANGTATDASLDLIETEIAGLYAGAAFRF